MSARFGLLRSDEISFQGTKTKEAFTAKRGRRNENEEENLNFLLGINVKLQNFITIF